MTTPTISHWLKVDITLKHKEDLSTSTMSLINRAEISDISANDTYPILLGVSRLGTSSDREMVLPDSGSFRLLDSIGSLGVDRKFSDLLERYEIIDQPVTVYYKETSITDYDPSSFDSVFIGKVLDYDCQIDQNLPVIDIRFDSRIFDKRIVTKVINPTDHTTAPIGSIGKALPVVIGENIQVKPVEITASGATSPIYAYATTLNTEHPVGGVQKYYVRDLSNNYTQVLSASDIATAVLSQEAGAAGSEELGSGVTETHPDSYTIAFPLHQIDFSSTPYIITQIDVDCDGYNDPAESLTSGVIVCDIYTVNPFNGAPQYKIATSQRDCADFNASIKAAPDFLISFAFDTPVIMHNPTGYFLAFTQTDIRDNSGTVINSGIRLRIDTGSTESNWYRIAGGSAFYATSNIDIECYLYAVKMTDTVTGAHVGSDGLGDAYYTLSQRTAIPGYENPDISQLDWIVEIDGLKDDSGGSITGSASAQITTPHHAIELLTQEWSGSAWSASSNWDFTSLASTYSSGYTIGGATDGEVALGELIREVCRNSAYKIVLRSNGQLAPYAWGSELTSVTKFTQENSKVLRNLKLDSSYVVNNIKIGYDKQLIYFDSINLASQGIPSDFTASLNIDYNTAGYGHIAYSDSLYGKRYLDNSLYGFINTSAQATRLAEYYLSNFNQPPVYVELEIPFDYFSDLEVTNVIEIKHPSLPTYFGGSPNTKMSHYDGEEVDPIEGNIMTRAKTYRAQIESYRISFNEDAVPTLFVTCRLLLNSYDPT